MLIGLKVLKITLVMTTNKDGYAEALFEETYNDSKKKLDTPVKEKDGLFKDKYNILKYKNNSL